MSVSDRLVQADYALAACFIALALATICFFFYHRMHPAVVVRTYSLMQVIIVGCLGVYVSVVLVAIPLSKDTPSGVCVARW